MPAKHFESVAVGGTFDHMHAGHTAFLDFAFASGDHVYIGITTDNLVHSKQYRAALEPYALRVANLTHYLKSRQLEKRATMIPLNDIYGIASHEKNLQALIVTSETKANGDAINHERNIRNLPKLTLVRFPMKKGDDGSVIRSTRIRLGETNRNGDLYRDLFPRGTLLQLPQWLRPQLKQPLGMVIHDDVNSSHQTAKRAITQIQKLQPVMVITVGDIVTHTMKLQNMYPHISIIDFITRRKDSVKFSDIIPAKPKIQNDAGTIHPLAVQELVTMIHTCIEKRSCKDVLPIQGEEDLLTLPAILCTPLKSVVAYGQFGVGIVIVEITEEKKTLAAHLISQFAQKKLQ